MIGAARKPDRDLIVRKGDIPAPTAMIPSGSPDWVHRYVLMDGRLGIPPSVFWFKGGMKCPADGIRISVNGCKWLLAKGMSCIRPGSEIYIVQVPDVNPKGCKFLDGISFLTIRA